MPKKGFYFAVRNGRTPGIYNSWDECRAQIIGVKTAKWKRFDILQQAKEYVQSRDGLDGSGEGSTSKPIPVTDPCTNIRIPSSATSGHSSVPSTSTPSSTPMKQIGVLDTSDISTITTQKVDSGSEDADTTITDSVIQINDNQLLETGPSFIPLAQYDDITIGNNFQQNEQSKNKNRANEYQLPEHRFVQEQSSLSSDDDIEIIENPLKNYHMNQSTSEEFYKIGSNEEEIAVGIFWDIENVRMPRGVNPAIFITNIRKEFVDSSPKFCEKHFYVVCDVTAESNNIMKQLFEFHVRIVHVPRLKANSSDNVIRDLMHEFVGYNKFSRIILISGDCDFSHDIHSFRRNKKCDCVLIHNRNAKESMIHSASTAYLYTDLIYDTTNNNNVNKQQSTSSSINNNWYEHSQPRNGPQQAYIPLSGEALGRAYYRKKRKEMLTPRNNGTKRRF